jgi:hypothetical protein
MLKNPTIVASEMGPVLADYLVEYLPFETEHEKMMESVRLVLQAGLLSDEKILDLWKKSARKQAYLVGFLRARPDDLPELEAPRADADAIAEALADELSAGNAVAGLLVRVTSAGGQTFLKTLSAVLSKPPNQDIVTAGFDLLRGYFSVLRREGDPGLAIEPLLADGRAYAGLGEATASEPSPALPSEPVRRVLERLPSAAQDLKAMRVLSGTGYGLIRPVLPDPTTLGSLMRRKLTPVTEPLLAQLDQLRGRGKPA